MEHSSQRTIRVFIASPFFNKDQVDRIYRLEQALKRNPYVADVFSARYHQFEQLTFGSMEWRKATFHNDLKFLRRADVMVVILDFEGSNVDSGTAFEVGYGYAMQKPIILINEKVPIINLMMAESLHAYLTRVEDIAFYDFLRMPAKPYTGKVI
ncbi:nucleoside 2-deoxyribosyltransferase [Heyndrickxia acidicola]|uniref:Nucleoside 2-deoxyribosyltransferase n=1 Tax=Heyndrickxia acidicola TaxID=209389 RepID=A0ABU6MA06_9BACI|nr:nucleoside 2-deoxyribosyltransferase [Heyndrickxia acidicola]MED1201506.1 nucleoside 2-deoxyribosyltransferase [Heyndrickxia acidicola]